MMPKKTTTPETLFDGVDKEHLREGEENPLEQAPLDEDKIRLFYDEEGNLREIGGIDDEYVIQHEDEYLVLDVDSVDREWLRETLNERHIKEWLKEKEKKSRFFKVAFENFFLLLIKAKPLTTPRPTPRHYYLLRLLTEVIEQEDYENLSKKCTGHLNRSALVAKTWVDSIEKIIDEEDLKVIEQLEELQSSFKGVMADMDEFIKRASCMQAVPGQLDGAGKPLEMDAEGGEPCPGCGEVHQKLRPKTPKEMGLSAEEARKRLKELTKQFGELQEKVNQKIEENRDKIDNLAQTFAEQAGPEAKKQSDKLDSVAKSFGTDDGELKQIDMSDILDIMDRYKHERDIKMLVDQLGRMARIAQKTMRNMTKEVDNVKAEPSELGDNISKMMPSEMVNARHPAKRKDFKKRLLEKEIEQFETKGQAPIGRGPIITCKDTSGSMHGAPNAWASALYLAVSSVAAKQRRRSILINFSHGPMKISEFEKGDKFTKYIEEASYMLNGGTDFVSPLKKSLEFIEQSKWNKADILFISDGLCHVPEDFLKEFLKAKAKREFKVITILINVGFAGDNVVEKFSDKVYFLSDFQSDQDILETAFAL